jgi:hypothetical protein
MEADRRGPRVSCRKKTKQNVEALPPLDFDLRICRRRTRNRLDELASVAVTIQAQIYVYQNRKLEALLKLTMTDGDNGAMQAAEAARAVRRG